MWPMERSLPISTISFWNQTPIYSRKYVPLITITYFTFRPLEQNNLNQRNEHPQMKARRGCELISTILKAECSNIWSAICAKFCFTHSLILELPIIKANKLMTFIIALH